MTLAEPALQDASEPDEDCGPEQTDEDVHRGEEQAVATPLGIHWLHRATTAGAATWPYEEGWDVLAMTVSGPMNLWGPLLPVLTCAYYRRRRT